MLLMTPCVLSKTVTGQFSSARLHTGREGLRDDHSSPQLLRTGTLAAVPTPPNTNKWLCVRAFIHSSIQKISFVWLCVCVCLFSVCVCTHMNPSGLFLHTEVRSSSSSSSISILGSSSSAVMMEDDSKSLFFLPLIKAQFFTDELPPIKTQGNKRETPECQSSLCRPPSPTINMNWAAHCESNRSHCPEPHKGRLLG